MLRWAAVFLVGATVAAAFGFRAIAYNSSGTARVFFFAFLALSPTLFRLHVDFFSQLRQFLVRLFLFLQRFVQQGTGFVFSQQIRPGPHASVRRDFVVFFSSCYVRSRKPEELIYRIALEVTQRRAEECVFVDDRPLNLENPRRLGMKESVLQRKLKKWGWQFKNPV